MGHDDAAEGLAHAEFIGEDQGDGGVVGLPEGADQEKGEAHADGAFVIEFHIASFLLSGSCVKSFCRNP